MVARENKDDANIGKTAEKAKETFAGCEIKGQNGVVGLGAIGARGCKRSHRSWHGSIRRL